MNTRSLLSLVLALFAVGVPLSSQAEVEAITFRLDNNVAPSYTVPAGKVFLLEWYSRDYSVDGGLNDVVVGIGGGSILFRDFVREAVGNTNPESSGYFLKPLRFPQGASISTAEPPDVTEFATIFIGLLIDTADLYATVPSEFKQTGVASGQIAATLKQSSPRPTVVKVESSTDMETWTPDPTATVANTSDKTEKQVTVAANTPAKFVRAKVISRTKE